MHDNKTISSLGISVVIPVFNRENTIGYCINSVLNQTYRNIEIIVVDDCSCDNTARVIGSFKDDRIRYIPLRNKLGAQGARNVGIKQATNNWIAFLDSDDEWLPDKLIRQVEELKKVDFDEWTVVHANCYKLDVRTRVKDYWRLPIISGSNVYKNLLQRPGILFPALLVSKKALKKIGYLDEKVPSFQEWDTAIQLAKYCRYIHIDAPLFIYYLYNDDTISSSKKNDIKGYQYIIDKYKDLIVENCGTISWDQHLIRQIRACLEFDLLEEARQYFKRLSVIKGRQVEELRICLRYGIPLHELNIVYNLKYNVLLRVFFNRLKYRILRLIRVPFEYGMGLLCLKK